MTVQYTGCTSYFHSSKRYSTIHFAPTFSWNVSIFSGLLQPSLVRTGMTGATEGRVLRAAAAGVRGWVLQRREQLLICPCNVYSCAVDMTSKPATRPGWFIWSLTWQTRRRFWWVWKPRRQTRSRARRDWDSRRRERGSYRTRSRVSWPWQPRRRAINPLRICQHYGNEGCKSEDHLSNREHDIQYWYMQCVVCVCVLCTA
jgi:hypothetical protein